jgi:hypothetical protein
MPCVYTEYEILLFSIPSRPVAGILRHADQWPCTETTVCTNSPAGIIYKKDTLLTHYGQVRLIAPRSRDPLRITVFTDSICKKISVKPRNSCMFYSNIFFNYGIGMLPDLLGKGGLPTRNAFM